MKHFSEYRFPFAAFPALRIAVLLSLGIAISHLVLSNQFYAVIYTIAAVFLLWIFSEFVVRRKYLVVGSFMATTFYLILIFLFGSFLYLSTIHDRERVQNEAAPLSLYEWESVDVVSVVNEKGWTQSGREVYILNVQETVFPEGLRWNHHYKLRAYGNGREIDFSDKINARIRLYAFPEVRNPHEFDYGQWLINQSIFAHGEIEEIYSREPSGNFGWGTLREFVGNNITQLFGGDSAPIAKALFLGYKQELEAETRQAFSRAGLSHIMAVSGLHVGFIVAPFWLIIPWLWQKRWGKWLGLAGLTFLLIFYAGLTGFSASVSRASLMAWLLTYGKLFHKLRHSVNLTALAAIILLVLNPERLFDIGFQLSFAAVFIILLVMPETQRLIPKQYRYGWIGGLTTIVLISIIVQGGLFPILTYYFGEFSIVGPLANALVIPFLSVIIPVGLLFSLFGGFLGTAANTLVVPVSLSLSWIEGVASTLGSLEFGFLTVTHNSIFLYLIWLFIVLMIASIRVQPIRWKMVIGFLLALNLFLVESIIKSPASKNLKVTVLDVGQGDAIHLKTPNGSNLLIDTGRWSPMGNSGDRVLLPYLEYMGIEKLDAVILSHPHADHIGGLPTLIESTEIKTIYHSDYPYNSMLYHRYNEMAADYEVPLIDIFAGDMIEIDPAIRIFVLGPRYGVTPDRNPNNHSVVLRIQYGDTSFLFTGDAETDQERVLKNQYGDFLNTNFLKAGHHGSRTSSGSSFIEWVKPEKSAVSLAFRNRFRHPNREAVTELHSAGSKVSYTSLSGALIYESDGRSIALKNN